ncbi:hypothetical protein ACO0K7_18880 [Undibacterium sp. Ji67W]|uniref:hypothetical protein n=1 Tax=Undibacterium sp. Ji67W TaxID=3413042 RepID=UPI003BF1FFC3
MKKFLAIFAAKKVFILILLTAFLYDQQRAYSQALPVAPAANFVMNRAIAGVITKTAIARGFAANDPRIAATLVGAGTSLTGLNVASTVAGVGLGIAGAPVWLTIAASLGIFAVGAAIVAGKTSLQLNDGSLVVDASGSVPPQPFQFSGYVPPYFPWNDELARGVSIYRLPDCFSSQACYAFPPLPSGTIPFQKQPYTQDTRVGSVVFVYWSLNELVQKYLLQKKVFPDINFDVTQIYKWVTEPHFETNANGISRLVGVLSVERNCTRGTCVITQPNGSVSNPGGVTTLPQTRPWDSEEEHIIIDPVVTPNKFKNLDAASPAIPPESRTEPISPDTLAKLADQAWMKAAAQPEYKGVPYTPTQPIVTADAAKWQSENPKDTPKLGDLLRPANNPGNSSVPISQTVTADVPKDPKPDPAAVQNVNVVNAPKVDLGTDPNIAAPTLETTPDALVTLYPLITLFPELKNYQTPQHISECPKPQFSVFGKSFTMDSHCNLVEQNRLAIASVMAVVWVLVGIFILLSA